MAKDLKEISRLTFDSKDMPTLDNINTGCLQRIADSLEKIEAPFQKLISDNEYLRNTNEQLSADKADLSRKIIALKGVITKLKKKEAHHG